MNLNTHHSLDLEATGEDTLRLIASLPAPEGLEGRVHRALRSAPRQRRVLAWPVALRADAGWVRAAAAAAIVFVVAGGGWGVYSSVQPLQPGKAPTVPARLGAVGGFSGAGARRIPETLNGPVVSEAVKPAELHQTHKKAHKKGTTAAAPAPMAAPAAK